MDEENKNPNDMSTVLLQQQHNDRTDVTNAEPMALDLKTSRHKFIKKSMSSNFNINSLIMSKNSGLMENLVVDENDNDKNEEDDDNDDEADSNYHYKKNYFQQLNTNHGADVTSVIKTQATVTIPVAETKINRRKINRRLNRTSANRNMKANSDEDDDEDENEIYDDDDENDGMEEGEERSNTIDDDHMNGNHRGHTDQTKPNQNMTINSSYCKICKKEFCNKYFLKTHMANKHNVHTTESLLNLAMDPLSSSSPPPPSLPAASSTNQHLTNGNDTAATATMSAANQLVNQNTDSSLVEDYCELCNKQFCNKYYLKKHKLDVHGVHIDNNIKTYKKMDEPANVSTLQHDMSSASARANNSKSPLKTYNGVGGQQLSSPLNSAICASANNPLNLMFAANPYLSPLLQFPQLFANAPFELIQQLAMANEELLKQGANSVTTNDDASEDGAKTQNGADGAANTVACDLCQKEFFNEQYLNLHKINKHMQNGSAKRRRSMSSASSTLSTSSLSDGQQQQQHDHKRARKIDAMMQSQMGTADAATSSLSITNPAIFGIMDSYFAAKMADRVTCDICNKQVCNKYFLKTHKLKVHGCVDSTTGGPNAGDFDDSMEDQQQEIQDDVRMSPSSSQSYQHHMGNGSNSKSRSRPPALARVSCQICNKELCNKYFLRSHLLNAHNINMDETTPSSSSTNGMYADDNTDNHKPSKVKGDCDPIQNANTSTNGQIDVDQDDECDGGSLKPNSNVQAFFIDSNDDLFKANFLPCMVYLPVTKKLDKPVKLTLKLIPLPDIVPNTKQINSN